MPFERQRLNCKVLLLAAGKSSRFNGIKMLAKLADKTVIEHALNQVASSQFKHIFPVLGCHAEQITPYISEQRNTLFESIVYCEQSELGLGHTIAEAVSKVQQDATHIMIVLADQVALKARDYDRLHKSLQHNPDNILCASHFDGRSPPVVFPRAYFDELMQLTGDTGAKSIVAKHQDKLIAIDMPTAGFDLDVQQDLQQFKGKIRPTET